MPSSDTKASTFRKLLADLVTRTPCCCTSWGSSGVARASLFCTCTWAVSGSVPFSKVSVMVTLPEDSLVEAM
ncbi:hypothetical protein D3C71_1409710 [compost metagenome]